MSTDPASLTDEQLDAQIAALTVERARRWAAQSAQARAAEVTERAAAELDDIAVGWHAYRGGTGSLEDPVPWVAPTGSHDAWPKGSVVTHDGVVYASLIPANTTAPGTDGGRYWAVRDPDNPDLGDHGWFEWAPGTYYRVGDRVDWAGAVYVCTHEHQAQTGWEPDHPTMHAVWTKESP